MRLVIFAAGSLLISLASYALEVEESDQARWVTGGVGQQERQAIKAMADDFNVNLLFSSTEGHFFGSAKVLVQDAAGSTVMNSQAKGPYFYLDLAAGAYTVTATMFEQPQQKNLTVSETGRHELTFRWDYKDEPAEIVPRKETVIMLPSKPIAQPASTSTEPEPEPEPTPIQVPPAPRGAAKASGLYSSLVSYQFGEVFGLELMIAPSTDGFTHQGLLQCASGTVNSTAVTIEKIPNGIRFEIPETLQQGCLGSQFEATITADGLQGKLGEQPLFLPRAGSFWNR
jgi:hypothetical protein